MTEYILEQGDYLLRVLGAALCGLLIGYEREARMKLAGIRTHTIVAMAAALMVVISKYGFFDVTARESVSVDASRVPASVVTGIGFLEAGIILNRKNSISGVTTSAGIWATLGIGMAIGAGMWWLGAGCTVILLGAQYLFHRNLKILSLNSGGRVRFRLKEEADPGKRIAKILSGIDARVTTMHFKLERSGDLVATLYVVFSKDCRLEELLVWMAENPEIISID